ncbi:MAG: Sulphatase-modifying factor protein [Firmicutes bacterium]|nr:Sulphatase-modifying factor protein [Bacillota bacterium]
MTGLIRRVLYVFAGVWVFLCLITPGHSFAQETANKMVLVEGGTFRMGNELHKPSYDLYDKNPVRLINVKDFYIGKYEVTSAEYDLFCMATGRSEPASGRGGRGQWAVVNITWQDAADYCNWLSEVEGLTLVYSGKGDNTICDFAANGYRLPTEAEWEYAARGGNKNTGHKYSGSDNPDEVAWYQDNSGGITHPVGAKKTNELGLYDMSGNAAEWCWDRYFSYDRFGPPERNLRVFRGGSWCNSADNVRVSTENQDCPEFGFGYVGFRIARTAQASTHGENKRTQLPFIDVPGGAPADMVVVNGGTFSMGDDSQAERQEEKPAHQVKVISFYMAKYEVTFAQYDAFCKAMGRSPQPFDSGWGRGNCPVTYVSWQDAVEYCNWLSVKEGLTPAYSGKGDTTQCDFSANGYRLPTEAEWEYAARGGQTGGRYPYSGGSDAAIVTWYRDNSNDMTHPVGEKQANELGIYDMSGNVSEWCWDRYGRYQDTTVDNPPGGLKGYSRSIRGGNCFSAAKYLSVSYRDLNEPEYHDRVLGFRLVRRAY